MVFNKISRNLFKTIIAMSILINFFQMTKASEFDESKFCDSQSNTVIFLVDITSRFDDRSKQLFASGISKVFSNLEGGERVVINTIEDSFAHSKDLYEGCVPFCAEKGLFSSCTEGLIKLKSRQQKATISSVLNTLLNSSSDLERSDILRTVTYKAGPHNNYASGIRLYIFSDMIENSKFITGNEFFSNSVKKLVTKVKKNNLIPLLSEAEVLVFGIGRGGSSTRAPLEQHRMTKIQDFWKSFFSSANVKKLEMSDSLIAY